MRDLIQTIKSLEKYRCKCAANSCERINEKMKFDMSVLMEIVQKSYVDGRNFAYKDVIEDANKLATIRTSLGIIIANSTLLKLVEIIKTKLK